MVRLLNICFLISLFLISCHNKTTNKETQIINSKKSDYIDTINHYSKNTDYRIENEKYVFIITEINNHKVAIFAYTDSLLILFQNIDNKWIKTDSIEFDTYAHSFKKCDLNGDKLDDLLINSAFNMHGQQYSYVFISDKNKRLRPRVDIKRLFNLRYDSLTNMVSSYYFAGMHIDSKELYKWENDSLKLIRGVECSYENPNRRAILTFYIMKNGKRHNLKTIWDKDESIFDTALWKGFY